MAKKPDFSLTNTPKLEQYCKDNGFNFGWKNKDTGHAVVSGRGVEAYVYVQRMVTGVRQRRGVVLNREIWSTPQSYQFSKKFLDNLLLIGEKVTSHETRHGIKVTRIPAKLKTN